MEQEKTLKELVVESGFTINHLADNVLKVDASYLSACINGKKSLSSLREKILKDYLNKVSQVQPLV